jgi:hypothetical protein
MTGIRDSRIALFRDLENPGTQTRFSARDGLFATEPGRELASTWQRLGGHGPACGGTALCSPQAVVIRLLRARQVCSDAPLTVLADLRGLT